MSKKKLSQHSIVTPNHKSDLKSVVEKPKIFSSKDWITVLSILLITFLCFSNVKKYEFVNWDDDRNFYENELITSLNKENFWKNSKQIFKEQVIGNYNPLSIWTFAVEHRLHGKGEYNGLREPGKWHMTNLYLHLICVFFVFLISRRLGLKLWGAALVTALFAIHPMRVESVAWVTERKDVLFGSFYLAAMWLYIKNKPNPKLLNSILIYGLFILSLFSKIQAVILPISLVAVDYLLDRKFVLKSVINKWPMFLLSFAFGIYGLVVLKDQGSLETNESTFQMWQRIFIGSFSYIIYLVKSIVPFRLSPLYPYPSSLPSYFYPTILIFPLAAYACWVAYKKEWFVTVFSIVFFTANIFFLLQILGAGQGFIADRFTYIAYFGIFFGLGYILDKSTESVTWKIPALSISALAILIYSFLSYNQVKIWENTGTLWTHVLKYYDQTTLPFGNRANYYRDKKMYKEALSDYASAIRLKEDPQTFNSRARLYFDTAGNDTTTLKLALSDYNKAISMKKNDGEFWINRGATYARLGNLEQALLNIDQGLKLKPDHANGYLNRFVLNNAMATRFQRNSIEELSYLEKALNDISNYQKYKPYEADNSYEKARILRLLNRLPQAIEAINFAIRINSGNGLYYYERAIIQNVSGNNSAAIQDLNEAIKLGFKSIDPNVRAKILGS